MDGLAQDADGDAVEAPAYYKLFVLSVADGVTVHSNSLSGASNEVFLVGTTAIPEADDLVTFTIYPNPASDILHIEFESATAISMEISVVDVSGKVLLSEPAKAVAGKFSKSISLSGWAQGTYWVRVSNGMEMVVKEFVVK